MKLEQDRIRLLFDQGALKKAVITFVELEAKEYRVHFVSRVGDNVVCVKARTSEERIFKSLDAAVSFVKKIGFKKSVEVQL
ncbi:hypothetical protein F2Z80_25285 [Vibrio fortis]|uniref:Plasmid replication protein RepB n=1 Tax=Vibrio fortis TaxID=212667 RepID=A0A5N3RX74_9VIBR|nr:hypothetical protein [Vibrio fortis]KAB0299143.1 hypothetical protein F2Z80_25225 [Vibrio fortis]KAB0299154.1 hypothetical protein F2Z80_25285 [Vibrio fortis]|tara:strand:- start:8796 stop:9038 length:243 start_codon:yes stop_codon:yes gene_type:complete